MTEIAVQQGVPVPPRTSAAKGRSRYPFEKMAKGTSFFVPGAKPESLRVLAWRRGVKLGWKFSVRATTEDGQVGARCWRVG